MNWNDIKNGLNSKPARIIYAIIVIAAIMTAVGFGIYYLYGLLTKGACASGQYYHEGDGVCYPGECANDCDDDNAERNWNKENKTCDCKCIDGYNNNNFDKKCNSECAKGASCDSGQTCAYVQSHNNPEIQCLNNDDISYYGKVCKEDYNDSNLNLYCIGDFKCDGKGNCIEKTAVKCDKGFVQACDSNDSNVSSNNCTDHSDNDKSPYFNQLRKKQGSKSRLGTRDKGTNCCDPEKITLAMDENLNSMYGSCCFDNQYPAIATEENRSGCCHSEPCKFDGKCVLKGYTCTTDGICPNNKVYKDEHDNLKCCTDGIVYQNVNNGKTVTHCSTKDHKIYIKTDGGKCNADSDCSSNKHQQCIGIRQSDNSFDGPFCRAYCDAGYDVEGNTCNLSNICGWDIETGNAEFTPEQPPALSTGKFNVCNDVKRDGTKKYWKAPKEVTGTDLKNYQLNIVSTATADKCNKVPQGNATDAMKASCSALFDSYYETSDTTGNLSYNTKKNAWECSATLNCCNIKPNIKKPKSNSVRLENFGDSPSPPSPNACNSREGIGPNESWITQDVGAENISAVWNGTNYNTQGNKAMFIPFDNELRPKTYIKYSYLNNGEFCDKLSLDGTTCEDYAEKSICPMTKKPFTENQYKEKNLQCFFPLDWRCNDKFGSIGSKNGWNYCCHGAGILKQNTGTKQPGCDNLVYTSKIDDKIHINTKRMDTLWAPCLEVVCGEASGNTLIDLINYPNIQFFGQQKNPRKDIETEIVLSIFRTKERTPRYLSLEKGTKSGSHQLSLSSSTSSNLNIYFQFSNNQNGSLLADYIFPGGLIGVYYMKGTNIKDDAGDAFIVNSKNIFDWTTKEGKKIKVIKAKNNVTMSKHLSDQKTPNYMNIFPILINDSIYICAAFIEQKPPSSIISSRYMQFYNNQLWILNKDLHFVPCDPNNITLYVTNPDYELLAFELAYKIDKNHPPIFLSPSKSPDKDILNGLDDKSTIQDLLNVLNS